MWVQLHVACGVAVLQDLRRVNSGRLYGVVPPQELQMAKLGMFASVATIVAALGFATLSSNTAAADGDGCKHKDQKTEMMKEACKKGQGAAKDAMKAFMKKAHIKSCNQCHSKLAPNYDLKTDAYDQFKKAGGK
jgi:hypothetical protein